MNVLVALTPSRRCLAFGPSVRSFNVFRESKEQRTSFYAAAAVGTSIDVLGRLGGWVR